MTVVTRKLQVSTKAQGETIDITPEIQSEVTLSNLSAGTVTVFVMGSTAGITTIEYEPGVVSDFKSMFERIIPESIRYDHDRKWGDGNGHSHVRSSLLGPSLVVPFSDRKLLLGTWQQVILVDFDNRPRTRTIVLQLMGE